MCVGQSAENGAIERAAHFDRLRREHEFRRRREHETVAAIADAGLREVFPIAVRQHSSDQASAGIDVEAHRRLGMIDGLRPTDDATRTDVIDATLELAGPLLVGDVRQARTLRNAPPHGLDLVASP